MTTAVTAALVSCGTLAVQSSLAGSISGFQSRWESPDQCQPVQFSRFQNNQGWSVSADLTADLPWLCRPAQQRGKGASQPAAASSSIAVEANAAEAVLVTGKACSPPK